MWFNCFCYESSPQQAVGYPDKMKSIMAILITGLFFAGTLAGCIGSDEVPAIQEIEEEQMVVDFNTIMATPPTDTTETMAHWRFDEVAGLNVQYDVAVTEIEHFLYEIKLCEGIVALEAHADWGSQFMDIDMYLLKKGKDTGICTPNYMVMDPLVIAQGDQGTTWEYFNAVLNQTKKFSVPDSYTIDIEIFNNWDAAGAPAGTTPWSLDIWVYTEVPAGWHPHQELGE